MIKFNSEIDKFNELTTISGSTIFIFQRLVVDVYTFNRMAA